MGFELNADSASFVINFFKLAVSGLEIGVKKRPIGAVNVDGCPDEGLEYNSANPTTLTAKVKEDWSVEAWKWQRSKDGQKWDNITDATKSTYQIVKDDDGNQIRVIATTAHGKAASDAMQVGAVLVLEGGGVDQELKASVSNTNPDMVEFEWKRLPKDTDSPVEEDWKPFEGAGSSEGESTYTPTLADCGAKFRVVATYQETKQTLAREYPVPEVVINGEVYKRDDNGEKVVVGANACVGEELFVKEGTGGQAARFAYSWHLNDESGTNLAHTRSYIVALACGGKGIVTRMQYTDANGGQVPAQPVNSSAVMIAEPTVTVTPDARRVGDTLTAAVNITERAAASEKGISVKYQWYDKSNPSKTLAETKTYSPTTGGTYQVRVTLHDNANREQQLGELSLDVKVDSVTGAPA